jgi:1-phosphofructokinase family hexose kinase
VILSAGLTPAWQQILVFDAFRYGEVNRARDAIWCASGKVTNAGIAAHHLGGDSLTLTTVGGTPLREFEREFTELGVPRRWIETRSATRVCTTILDRANAKMTELVENGRPLEQEELDAVREAYAEEVARAQVAVITGSLPAGTPDSFYRELMEKTPCPAVLDIRGVGLLSVLDLKPLVVKPNREELSQTVGRSLETDEDLQSAMRSLNERGAGWVFITQGAGPVWVSSGSAFYRVHTPQVADVVNPIGCGDAVAAGIAWAVRDGREMLDAVRLGIAAAGENVQQMLPCRLDLSRVEKAAAKIDVEKVQ